MKLVTINPNSKPYYSEDFIKGFQCGAERQFEADKSAADRPQGEWIFHYRDKWMVKAECPKCHRRFEFSPRTIWKCCPMCETRMKGVSNEADSDKSK